MLATEKPTEPNTIQMVRGICSANAKSYHAALLLVPWSAIGSDGARPDGASLWPVCPKGISAVDAANLAAKMPFDEKFWTNEDSKFSLPQGVRGYFTILPVYWTVGENNHPEGLFDIATTPFLNSLTLPVKMYFRGVMR